MKGLPVWSTSTVRPCGSAATTCALAVSATASLQVCGATRSAELGRHARRSRRTSEMPPERQASACTMSMAPARISSRKPCTPNSFSPAASGTFSRRRSAT